MAHYYDPVTRGCFDTATHAPDQIPASAIQITLVQKRRLLEGERTGSVIVINSEGGLVLEKPEQDPGIPARIERAWRDIEIQQISWLRDRHRDELDQSRATTLATEQFNELLVYIQQLRDWPQAEHFPDTGQRPTAPHWLTPQTP